MLFRSFESPAALLAASGSDLGFSDWHAVSQERVDSFAHATGDGQWIHTDPQRAASGPFGGTIAHGYLTLSMIPMMMWEVSRVDNAQMAVNYGLDKVRFPTPVLVGSRVRARVLIGEVTESARGILVPHEVTVESDSGSKPVCVAQTLTLYVP